MKKLILFCVFICLMLGICACDKDKAGIIFNHNPITKENVVNYSNVFAPNQRIYYLIFMPKKVETRNISIQIVKQDNKYERYGYKLYWSRSARLKDEQIYYYDDYVVISETGAYTMQVFSKDNPTKVLCENNFWVRKN